MVSRLVPNMYLETLGLAGITQPTGVACSIPSGFVKHFNCQVRLTVYCSLINQGGLVRRRVVASISGAVLTLEAGVAKGAPHSHAGCCDDMFTERSVYSGRVFRGLQTDISSCMAFVYGSTPNQPREARGDAQLKCKPVGSVSSGHVHCCMEWAVSTGGPDSRSYQRSQSFSCSCR